MKLNELGGYRAGAFSAESLPWTGVSVVDARRGLAGLGDLDIAGLSVAEIADLVQKGLVAFNSQQVFQMNLDRAAAGLAPIPVSLAAPTVNLGLNADTQRLVVYGALAAIGLYLFSHR